MTIVNHEKTMRTHGRLAVNVALLSALALLALPAYSEPKPQPGDKDAPIPMVRGAMGQASLAKYTPKYFNFATDGPGLLTVCWTEPDKPHAVEITHANGGRVPLGHSWQHGIKAPFIRTFLIPLKKPGKYTLQFSAKQETQMHLGYAWAPFEPIKKSDVINQVNKDAQRFNLQKMNNPAPLRASTHERDPNHWLAGFPTLPIGHTVEHESPSGLPKTYHYPAEGPGVLTLIAHGKDDADISITYESHTLKPIAANSINEDFGGQTGAEQTAAIFPSPDNIAVRVSPIGGGAYELTGSWISLHGVIEPIPLHGVILEPAP